MTDKDRKELLELLERTEDDYWSLPQYGFVCDWFSRYWTLHNRVCELLDIEPYNEPMYYYNDYVKECNKPLT